MTLVRLARSIGRWPTNGRPSDVLAGTQYARQRGQVPTGCAMSQMSAIRQGLTDLY